MCASVIIIGNMSEKKKQHKINWTKTETSFLPHLVNK